MSTNKLSPTHQTIGAAPSAPARSSNNVILDAALQALKRGWSVFPISVESKTPMVKWTKFQDEMPSVTKIRNWFGADFRHVANLGLATGELSGRVVLDVDELEGLEEIERLGGVPHTQMVQTRPDIAHKLHFHFEHPGFDCRNFAKKFRIGEQEIVLPGLDFRGDGGYVMLPPSRHHSGAGNYEWLRSPDEAPLAPMPEWLFDLLKARFDAAQEEQQPRPITAVAPALPILSNSNGNRERKYVQSAIEREQAAMNAAGKGMRHEQRRNSAIALGSFVPHLLSEQEVTDALAINFGADKRGAMDTIKDGIAYGRERPRQVPPPRPNAINDYYETHADEYADVGHSNGHAPNGAAPNSDSHLAANDASKAMSDKVPKAASEDQPETTEEARGPYALNEIGNGKRFADANRGRYLFDYTTNRWRVYTRGVWRHTDGDDVERAAKIIEAQICDEARGETDDDRRAKLYKHAASITKRKTRETMLKDAASELDMSAPPEKFDAQLHLFNVKNGTLDLRTGELKPHSAPDLLTKCAGTKFDPSASAPTWTRALEMWIPDAATRDYLQECAGLSLSGEVRDEFFNFLFGGGDNGKTTFLSPLQEISGDYFQHSKAEIFMRPKFARDGEAAQPALLSLQGARLLTVSEVESEHEMSAALVKGLTGRDPVKVRGAYDKRPTTFTPQFTLWMFGNEKPKIADASNGMWRRVRLIEFNQAIPKDQRDENFGAKLDAELPGILNWALDGLKRVQQRGLIVPDTVKASTASYRAEQSPLDGFTDEVCEQSPTAFVTAADLWNAWRSYCSEQDEPEGTQKAFGVALKNRNFKDARIMVEGRQVRVWKGVRLKF